MFIYENRNWPTFEWNSDKLLPILSLVRNKQGRLIGKMSALGFELRDQANLEILTLEIIKSTEIEGAAGVTPRFRPGGRSRWQTSQHIMLSMS